MLLTKTVLIKLTKLNIDYYKGLGYNGEIGESISIKTEDLPENSSKEVEYKCDYDGCQAIKTITYSRYLKRIRQEYSQGKYVYCRSHIFLAQKEWMKENCVEEYEKKKKERQDKYIKTCMQRYGTTNVMKVESVKLTLKNTIQRTYGVDNVMKLPETRKKIAETMGIGKKIEIIGMDGKVMYMVNGIPCSKNQLYINNLYGGEMNYMIKGYSVDILLENKIYFEYNGSGHKLNVIMHKMSEEDFMKKEAQRYYILKQQNYKLFLMVSTKYRALPSDDVLLSMKELAIEYLNILGNNWIEFNYDNKYIRTKNITIPYLFDKKIELDVINTVINNNQ